MKQIFLFATLMLITTLGWAGVYKCTTPGGVVYAENPCEKNATALNLRTKEPSATDVSVAQEKLKKDSISNDIAKIRREIRGYQGDMDQELATLRQKQELASNNIAGATWLSSISEEMAAVTNKYQVKIQEAQHRLDALNSSK